MFFVEQAERVVLLADQLAHRRERRLVLEAPIHDRPNDAVPAIGPDVTRREDLSEHPRPVVQGHQQRRRAARPFRAERFDPRDREAELIAERSGDRVDPIARQVEVRGVASTSIGHRERVVGREPSERERRDREPECDGVHARIHVGRAEDRASDHDEHGEGEREGERTSAPRAARRQREDDHAERDREGRNRRGREVPVPARRRHDDGARRRIELEPQQARRRQEVRDADRDDRHEQVPEPEEPQEHGPHREAQHDDPGLGREPVQRLRDRQVRVVLEVGEPGEESGRRVRAERRHHGETEQDHDDQGRDDPRPPGGLGQRWRLTRRSPMHAAPAHLERSRVARASPRSALHGAMVAQAHGRWFD